MNLKTTVFMMLTAAAATGCGVAEKRAQENQGNRVAIAASERLAVVRYQTPDLCAKAFAATKVYLMNKSDMRVQLSDDTLVATYGPTKLGHIGITASRKPEANNSCTIALNTRCRGEGQNDNPGVVTLCRVQIVDINENFRPYIEQAVGQPSR